MISQIVKDNKGKNSSMRVILILATLLLIYQLYEYRVAYRLEIIKEEPNYNGLALLFGAMVINFVFVVILKVIQKKYEEPNIN